MLKTGMEEVVLPQMRNIVAAIDSLARTHASQPMLSRTHGQTRHHPTTLGKEMANVAFSACKDNSNRSTSITPLGKINGAVGNYNAHLCAYSASELGRACRAVCHQPRPAMEPLHHAN